MAASALPPQVPRVAAAPVSHASIQEIVCVFGQPVAGNPTQYMMEKAFAEAGLDWRYLTLEVAARDAGRRRPRHAGDGLSRRQPDDPAQGRGAFRCSIA